MAFFVWSDYMEFGDITSHVMAVIEKFYEKYGHELKNPNWFLYERFGELTEGDDFSKIRMDVLFENRYASFRFDNNRGIRYFNRASTFFTTSDIRKSVYYHNLYGPALETVDGSTKIFYINNKCVNTIFPKWLEERELDLKNLSEEDKMIIQFEWGHYGM